MRDEVYEQYVTAHVHSRQDGTTASGYLLTLLAVFAYVAYQFLVYAGIPLRAIPQILWNHSTRIMPPQLASPLRRLSSGATGAVDSMASRFVPPSVRSSSGNILKRVFGLDGDSLLKGIQLDVSLRGMSMLLKRTSTDTPPGLGNWDNSCYQNSVIQGLASLKFFQGFLSMVVHDYTDLSQDSTSYTLFGTVNKLNDPSNHGQRLWTPAKLKPMSSWQQQDAQEYYSKILDEVDKELIRAAKALCKTSGLEVTASLMSIDESRPEAEKSNEQELGTRSQDIADTQEHLRNPLEGMLAQRVGCTRCGYSEGLSMIPFNCLTVPLGRNPTYDVRDCLDEYTKLELIEGVECARCTLLRTQAQLERLLESSTTATSAVSDDLRRSISTRLTSVQNALENADFSDNTLSKDCQISKKNWVSSTKSRQAVIARAPRSLVIHVNRSLFDEYTGAQMKNYADVSFPRRLDLGAWCLGSSPSKEEHKTEDQEERWSINPTESMLPSEDALLQPSLTQYELRAVVSHYGRHENGHYICYRKHPYSGKNDSGLEKDTSGDSVDSSVICSVSERWWRLSDEDVSRVTEDEVLHQGGVFMLFYEQVEASPVVPTHAAPGVKSVVPVAEAAERISTDVAPSSEELMEVESQRATSPHMLEAEPSLVQQEAAHSQPPSDASPATSAEPDMASETAPNNVVTDAEIELTDDGSSMAVTSDDESEVDPLHVEPPAFVHPTARQPLLMRTAGSTDGRQNDHSLSSSPFRMVSAT